jgi:hypothetical protein
MFPQLEDPTPYEIIETQATLQYICPRPGNLLELLLSDRRCSTENCQDCASGTPGGLGCNWALVQQRDEATGHEGVSYCLDAGGRGGSRSSALQLVRGDGEKSDDVLPDETPSAHLAPQETAPNDQLLVQPRQEPTPAVNEAL